MATLIKGERLGVYTAPRATRGCSTKSRHVSNVFARNGYGTVCHDANGGVTLYAEKVLSL